MKRFLYFFAMSAVVLGMAFAFNSCGGNDANNPDNPEQKRFKMDISKISDTSVNVEIRSTDENIFFTDGYEVSETFLKNRRDYIQTKLNTYKKNNNPTYPEGLYSQDKLSLNGLDPDKEYAIYVCEVNEEYQVVGNVEYKRIKRGNVVQEQQSNEEISGVNPISVNGALPGIFTVSSDGKKVRFSQGNLQYNRKTDKWRFAINQYNGNNTLPLYDWHDVNFGWGTANTPTLLSCDYDDYRTFTDWGINPISNGGNKANLWRTLTADEWEYLIDIRTAFFIGDAENGRYVKATVNSVPGLILFPDRYIHPDGVTTPKYVNRSYEDGEYPESLPYTINKYDATDWGKMESGGAVFLPAEGSRQGSFTTLIGLEGLYWSSTQGDKPTPEWKTENVAYAFFFSSTYGTKVFEQQRYRGYAVRLVQDVK